MKLEACKIILLIVAGVMQFELAFNHARNTWWVLAYCFAGSLLIMLAMLKLRRAIK